MFKKNTKKYEDVKLYRKAEIDKIVLEAENFAENVRTTNMYQQSRDNSKLQLSGRLL